MGTHNLFCVEIRKILSLLSGAMYNRENPFWKKTGLNSGVVSFLNGLHSRLLLYKQLFGINLRGPMEE